jgi:hypothetical protein
MMILAALLAAQAPAASADSLSMDIRCLAVSAQLAESQDPTVRAAGQLGGTFYFGRVDPRLSSAELERRLWREIQALATSDMQALRRECGHFMSDRGRELIEISRRIAAREAGARTH